MDTKYSLTTLLNNLLKLQNNGYQIITKLSDVVSSNADTVEVDVMDSSGTIQKVYIPSYGSLKNQMVQMEQNIKSLSAVGDSCTSVQLSDGSFRKILVSSLLKEAEDIQTMPVPTTFNKKENWFFESFLNPLLYVSFNLTGQVKYETEKIEVARYILNLDTPAKLKLFNTRFSGKSDVKFADFSKIMIDNGITFFLDKDVVDMPPRTLRYSGKYTVTNIFDDTLTSVIDGASIQNRVLRVQLDKLTYNDNQSKYLGTQSLKIGDSLVVNSGRQNTRFEILNVDASKRTVAVKLIEGFDNITIGRDSLSFYGEDKSDVFANVSIGFNEYCVIFVKPIDPDSRIQSINWSPGVGLYTNNLKIIDPVNGNSIALSTFYQNEVVDFGAYLYSTVKDKTPPSIFAVQPSPPVVSTGNFQVLPINEHITSSGNIVKIKTLQSDKLRVQSQLTALDKSITEAKTKVQTTKYSSQKLQDTDNSKLSKLIDSRSTNSSLYASIVEDITKLSSTNSIDTTPKYRVRGFFPIPVAKLSDRTEPQEVIQFITQYRYIKKDGSANQPQQIPFIDNNGIARRGTFSTWVEYKSPVRKRNIDSVTGKAYWAQEEIENSDSVNINQIDFPIQSGESIEFRIKSISEAGWPVTNIESDWSEIVRIDFPTEFESIPDTREIIEQAKMDQIRVQVKSDLTNLNLDRVSQQTIIQNGKFFIADSVHVASGFLTPENNIITLFDKLNSMDLEIQNLRGLIANAKGSISVTIVDDNGQEYSVEKNTTISLFAGNYRDQVASLPIKKGVIITKNYFIKISNEAASVLELYSRTYGSKFIRVNHSNSQYSSYNANDIDYNLLRRYDYVPLGLSNPEYNGQIVYDRNYSYYNNYAGNPSSLSSLSSSTSFDESLYTFIQRTPYQSPQVLGQFINSRYTSVDGTRALYSTAGATNVYQILDLEGNPVTQYSQVEWTTNLNALSDVPLGSNITDFIWAGGTGPTSVVSYINSTVATALQNNIQVHINHPDIKDWIANAPSNIGIPVADVNSYVSTLVRNSKLANSPKGSLGSSIQTAYFRDPSLLTSPSPAKICFDNDDQFLLGTKSVGAYLFVNPNSHVDIRVNGDDAISYKDIKFGNVNSISIPVTFQYRMTDYFGVGDLGLGNVKGDPSSNSGTNLEYTKTIGIDIYPNPLDKERFSFDLEVTARYYSKSVITKDIPTRTFETALDDLTKTIKVVTPTTSRDQTIRRGSSTSNS